MVVVVVVVVVVDVVCCYCCCFIILPVAHRLFCMACSGHNVQCCSSRLSASIQCFLFRYCPQMYLLLSAVAYSLADTSMWVNVITPMTPLRIRFFPLFRYGRILPMILLVTSPSPCLVVELECFFPSMIRCTLTVRSCLPPRC